MVVVGLYIYSLESSSYTYIPPFGETFITLPISVWIVGIIFVFFVATLLFLASSFAKDVIESYQRKHDYDKLLSQINEQALNQAVRNRVYKRKAFGDLSKILQRFYLKPRLDSNECFNKKIDVLFEHYKDVMSGKVVELKNYNLSADNKFYLQNLKNKISANYKQGFVILQQDYPEELKNYAILAILKHADTKELEKILKSPFNLTKPITQELFSLYIKSPKAIDVALLCDALKSVATTQAEYIAYARESKGKLSPDKWIRFFEMCADNDENAEIALFFVLFELEMIDRAKERHRTHQKGEYNIIDAYLDLKSSGKHYGFDIFLINCVSQES